jgi:hypothetical protein
VEAESANPEPKLERSALAKSVSRICFHSEDGFSSAFFSDFGSGNSTPNTYFENHEYSRRILSS